MKLTLVVPIVALAVGSLFVMRENMYAGLALLGEAFLVGLVFICIIPVAYRICIDKIQIAFRIPWSFDIPFSTISMLRSPRWYTAGINLPTCFSSSRALEIVRIKRMTVNISPSNRQVFISNFEKIYGEWKRENRSAI
jgi:hypothetical protein